MNLDTFNMLVEECRAKKPILFGLGNDKVLSAEEIGHFENTVHIILPDKYKEFIASFGGGYFGHVNIYSLDENSDFYLLKHNNLPFDNYVRIADNSCGDYYLLCIENGKCLEPLFFYDHESGSVIQTEYMDIFEYLVKVGLKKKFP